MITLVALNIFQKLDSLSDSSEMQQELSFAQLYVPKNGCFHARNTSNQRPQPSGTAPLQCTSGTLACMGWAVGFVVRRRMMLGAVVRQVIGFLVPVDSDFLLGFLAAEPVEAIGSAVMK